MNNFDFTIKQALLDEVKHIPNREDDFTEIMKEIETGAGKENKAYANYTSGYGFRRRVSLAICFFVVCSMLVLASSNQVRAFASQVIASVKTIFIVEKEGEKLQIVEKPGDEVFAMFSVSRTTNKSDEELKNLLGYDVKFPDFLADSFKLDKKNLSIVLKKQVNYETKTNLQTDMFKAIEDNDVMIQLKPYSPVRTVSATYKKTDRSTIYIDASQAWKLSDIENHLKRIGNLQGLEFQKVKVADLDGYWIKAPNPDYPIKTENGVGEADMSIKPEISERYLLCWEKIRYILYNELEKFQIDYGRITQNS